MDPKYKFGGRLVLFVLEVLKKDVLIFLWLNKKIWCNDKKPPFLEKGFRVLC